MSWTTKNLDEAEQIHGSFFITEDESKLINLTRTNQIQHLQMGGNSAVGAGVATVQTCMAHDTNFTVMMDMRVEELQEYLGLPRTSPACFFSPQSQGLSTKGLRSEQRLYSHAFQVMEHTSWCLDLYHNLVMIRRRRNTI